MSELQAGLQVVWLYQIHDVFDINIELYFGLMVCLNRTPGSRSYSDLLDTLADSVCIHLLVLKRRSKR